MYEKIGTQKGYYRGADGTIYFVDDDSGSSGGDIAFSSKSAYDSHKKTYGSNLKLTKVSNVWFNPKGGNEQEIKSNPYGI